MTPAICSTELTGVERNVMNNGPMNERGTTPENGFQGLSEFSILLKLEGDCILINGSLYGSIFIK